MITQRQMNPIVELLLYGLSTVFLMFLGIVGLGLFSAVGTLICNLLGVGTIGIH